MDLAYLDSSVILRVVLDEKEKLREFYEIKQGITSLVTRLECLRAIDRLRHSYSANDEEVAQLREIFFSIFKKVIVIPVSEKIIDFASQPLEFSLKSLDAIHYASVQLYVQSEGKSPVFMTHDEKLGLAVKSSGLKVLGLKSKR